MSNLGFRVGAPNADTIARKRQQLSNWEGSDTNSIDLTRDKASLIQFQRNLLFQDSVAQQDTEEVEILLTLGVDVNYANTDGITALHQVCIDGNAEMAGILLTNGPDINAQDNDGWTPLHAASQCGFTDLARLLLEHGADIACVDNEGQLPIDKAEDDDDMRQLLADWMRKKAVDIEKVRTAEERAIRENCMQVIRSKSKVLDVVTVDGATILHCAAAKGLPDCIAMLSRASIEMNLQDHDGWTPLHAAAKWAQPEAIEALIENGADIHIVNTFAETALDIADEDVLDMLREYYDANPARNKPIVPGVDKFLNPVLPDKSAVQPITKGSRKLRENKENRPEKLIKKEEPKKEEPAPPAPIVVVEKPKSRSRFDPAAAVENKPGPAIPAWINNRKVSNDAIKRPAETNKLETESAKRRPAETNKLDVESAKRQSIPTINTEDSASDKAEIVRKKVSRQKRNERRSTQAVTLEEITAQNKQDQAEEPPTKEPAPPKLAVPNGPSDRHVPVTVSITDTGAVVWENKKSPEPEAPPPAAAAVNKESASDKAEVVRKKVARRKRDERRSTQHVSKDDLPAADKEEVAVDAAEANSKEKEDHLAKELELERKRYNESAEALARNQEDLRRRDVKIASLEKENESLRKKIVDLEEDLRRLQQVNSDNQRLKDENAALIRVIGKLSRNPL